MSTTTLLRQGLLMLACGLPLPLVAADGLDLRVADEARQVMTEYGIPGLAIGLTQGGEQRFYNFGVASRETRTPVDRDTLFEVGSISKTFTVTLAAYAEARGKLSLQDSPARHLPELRGSRLEEVTLLNLATHTAGGFPLQVPDNVRNQADLTRYFRTWEPEYAVGSTRSYANPSIGLLGVVAARSLGLPFIEAMEAQLFPRLGLKDTWLRVPASAERRYAQGYNRDDQPVRVNPGPLADEAYGVKTSSRDLLRFVEAQLGRPGLEPALARALATTRNGHYRLGAMTQDLIWEQYAFPVSLATLERGNGASMALESHPEEAISPTLPPQRDVWVNKTGSTNGFGAYVAFVPARETGIVVLANRNYPNEARVRLAYRILCRVEACSAKE
ncbi:class C beta-lactamase [Metapseudomonas furukawaii]|uniref:Beta-lactamase n=1 Tax=Metapseudomonas furukawaii TaxID=1149133 RepID=A0AAD1C2L9_METFU|nr:class C beta-lactamase [Pseudomonas furukawaii]ELS26603.1 Beta-lactamase [Pseudomonas furukawaii]BAU74439.1 beta-lactamase [Pseudomonas furukawaii]